MKRLVILGTSEDQHPLIRRAKELGYETHVYGWKLNMVKERVGDFYHEVNIVDHEALWNDVKKINACGVATCASEIAMHSMNFLLRKMGIPCNSIETEQIATNKYLMRCAMKNAGIDSPRFQLVNKDTPIEELIKFEYPVILKPLDESSSRGVLKVDCVKDVYNAINYALSWSKVDSVIMEDFVNGQEYSGESIAYKGKYKLLAITEKITTGPPHFIERRHKQPAQIDNETQEKVEKILYRAFKSMGIEYGAIHPEFKITKDGKIYFMEIAARMGGDFIGSELTYLSSGYDFLRMMIDVGCGKKPVIERTKDVHEAEVRFILSEEDLNEYEYMKKQEDVNIIKYSKWRDIPKAPILQNPDRAGYYIISRKRK